MILKGDTLADILRSVDGEDPFVIRPCPDLEQLASSGSASLDLRLGTWFMALDQARTTHLDTLDELPELQLTVGHYVPFNGQYVLHPQRFVLGVTLEWLRMPADMAAYVIGKSSWGRRGLIIATATGVHPGFKGCLTLELTNVGEAPITIKPGMTLCQLFVHRVEGAGHEVDRSRFVGQRKPSLGEIGRDPIAQKLAAAYGPRRRKRFGLTPP